MASTTCYGSCGGDLLLALLVDSVKGHAGVIEAVPRLLLLLLLLLPC